MNRFIRNLRPVPTTATAVAIALTTASCARNRGGDAVAAPGLPVRIAAAQSRTFEQRLALQGTVESANFALVPARVPGTIEKLFVDEGDRVEAGVTELFRIDSVKLEQAVELAVRDLGVARYSEVVQAANLDRADAEHAKAEADYERYRALLDDGAVSTDEFEQQELRFREAEAGRKHASTSCDLAAEQVKQAEAALTIARKDLADATVHAPISGTISARLRELGEMAAAGTAVFRIDDTETIDVSAFAPASAYAAVRPGETRVHVSVGGIDLGDRIVWYRSPTIDPALRTFEVKCRVDDPPAGIAPGDMATAEFVLDARDGVGVPRAAAVLRANGAVVFSVDGTVARIHRVETGWETDGWLEVVGADFGIDTPIVVMGQNLLDDGESVAVQEQEGGA